MEDEDEDDYYRVSLLGADNPIKIILTDDRQEVAEIRSYLLEYIAMYDSIYDYVAHYADRRGCPLLDSLLEGLGLQCGDLDLILFRVY